ncbi:MAG: FKBP-type peptidyl-prolyl cis-trans isomerase [Bacteroidales bacterium]|nr:FKBP-type peptidyl-prolyl cis-trans isomerase [Bacteroidales bacterium]
MKIEKNKVVVLSYDLAVEGKIIDRMTEEHPLDYIQGCHMLLPRFEEELEGKEEGETFSFILQPEEGYGKYDDSLRFDIPRTSFSVEGKIREDLLVPGNVIPMLNGAGEVCRAKVVEVKDDAVNVDFNHPMAGNTLAFTGKILSVRDATDKELLEGLHGEFLPREGCGKCGHHGGGCHHGDGGCGHHGEGEGCCHHGEGGEGCHHGDGECGCGGDGECGGGCGDNGCHCGHEES